MPPLTRDLLPPAPATPPVRIFLLEDEAAIALDLADRLERLGYVIAGIAAHGEIALGQIAAAPPDLVLVDANIAGPIDGIETAVRLRAVADVAVVFLTAYADPAFLARASAAGAFGYLLKPFEERELNATLQLALYKHRLERALREANDRLEERVRARTADLERANAELRASEERLAVTLDSIDDAVIATDAQGRVTRMNPVAERLTGWPQAEALGRPVAKVLHLVSEDTREPLVLPLADVLASGHTGPYSRRAAVVARDGSERGVADIAAPIRDGCGRILGAVFALRDETDARQRTRLIASQREMLNALRRVHEEFIDAPGTPAAFGRLAELLVRATGSEYGFLGEVLRTGEGRPFLRLGAVADHTRHVPPSGLLADFASAARELHDLDNLVGDAITRGAPVVANDVPGHARGSGLPAGHPPVDCLLGIPVQLGGQVIGLAAVANRRGGYRDEMVADLAPLLATYTSLVLAARMEAQRGAAERALVALNADLEGEVRRRTAALAESERVFETLATASPVGIFRCDAQGACLYVNARWREMAGLSEDAAMGGSWLRAVDDADRERVGGEWASAVRARTPFRSEFRLRRPDGQVTWVLGQAVGVSDARGEHSGYIGTVTDVTEHKQTEFALREITTELRALQGDAFFHATARKLAALLDCEVAFICLPAASQDGVIQTVAMLEDGVLVPNFAYHAEPTPCARTLQAGVCIIPAQVRSLYPDDHYLAEKSIESYAAAAITDRAGRTIGHIGIMARHRLSDPSRVEALVRLYAVAVAAEMERQRGAQRFHDLFEFAADGIVMADPHGRITLANRQAARMFGWSREELLERRIEDLVPPAVRPRHAALRESFVASASRRRMGSERSDLSAVRKDGTVFPVEISLNPIVTDEGVMVAAAVRDITEQRRAQEQVLRLNAGLEDRVRERTSELAAALADLESFSYSVSHDLRAPVRAMTSYSQILIEEHGAALDADARRMLARIVESGEKMNDMIDGLLDLGRLSRHEISRRRTDLSQLARETWAEVVLAQPGRSVAFAMREDIVADCDPVLMRSVLQNLLGNAFKYTRDAAAARVEFGAQAGGAQTVYFVRDNGVGFDMAHASGLFGPFQRLHGSDFEGTGIGLATVQRIVQRHGGRIWAEAERGCGATFRFTLATSAPPGAPRP